MNDLYRKLMDEIGSKDARDMNLQVLGLIEEEPYWSVYGLQHSNQYAVLRLHFQKQLPACFDNFRDLLDLMKDSARVYSFIKRVDERIRVLARS